MKGRLRIIFINSVKDTKVHPKKCNYYAIMDCFMLHMTIYFEWCFERYDSKMIEKKSDQEIKNTVFKKEMYDNLDTNIEVMEVIQWKKNDLSYENESLSKNFDKNDKQDNNNKVEEVK